MRAVATTRLPACPPGRLPRVALRSRRVARRAATALARALVVEFAHQLARDAEDEGARRKFLALADECVGPDDRFRTDDRAVQQDRAHPDQCAVADLCAVDDRAVSDGH